MILATAALIFLLIRMPLGEAREAMQEWIADSGRWGMLWYFLIGTVLSVVFFPITPIILSGGLLFGFKIGLGLAIAVLACGSVLGFLLGRRTERIRRRQDVAEGGVESGVESSPRSMALWTASFRLEASSFANK